MLRAYRQERLPLGHLLGVCLPLTCLARIHEPRLSWHLGIDAALMGGLFVMFRLWDDLMDVEADRGTHPTRVLCRAQSLFLVRAVCVGLGLAVAFALQGRSGPCVALMFAASCGAMHIWYGTLRPRVASHQGRYHGLLLKYPVCVGLVAQGAPAGPVGVGVAAAFTAYVGAIFYEIAHNKASSKLLTPWLALEACLGALAVVFCWRHAPLLGGHLHG